LRYVGEDERIYIADRLREQASYRVIAKELARSPSTISREIRRNSHPGTGQYRPYAAQRRADACRPRPKVRKLAAHPVLRQVVQDHLDQKWSPEQIARRLRRDFPDRPEMHVAHETIYRDAPAPRVQHRRRYAVYFCDPHSPWQRGSNETPTGCYANTFPKAPTYPCTPASTSTPSLLS
jgi:IS30 family transposase